MPTMTETFHPVTVDPKGVTIFHPKPPVVTPLVAPTTVRLSQ